MIAAPRVFDGVHLLRNRAVLVERGRVVAVGSAASLARPGVRVVRFRDATLVPGFVDLHVHRHDDLFPRAAREPGQERATLAGGVTTVRNVGEPAARLVPPHDGAGRLRVLGAGPLVTVPGGYPIAAYGSQIAGVVRSPAAARRLVRRLVARGAALVKLGLDDGGGRWPMLSVAEIRAIVAEAHRLGRIVTAHADRPEALRRALAGGVDELAHMPCWPGTAPLLRRVAARRIPVVGTLHVLSRFCPDTLANARLFVRLGGRLLYGSDAGNPGIPYGIDVEELRLLVAAGLSRAQALAAATSRAAAELGLPRLGRLAAGSPADLVVVRGNPLRDLDSLRRPLLVVAGGVTVS